jgi:hypothetical protein
MHFPNRGPVLTHHIKVFEVIQQPTADPDLPVFANVGRQHLGSPFVIRPHTRCRLNDNRILNCLVWLVRKIYVPINFVCVEKMTVG